MVKKYTNFEIKLIRSFDIFFALFGLLILSPLFVMIYMLGLFDTGKPLLIQKRIGKNGKPFKLFKFRTMNRSTEDLPSFLVGKSNITPLGERIRRYKIDELPQLFNVLRGDMSLVGPRPVIDKEINIITNRKQYGILDVLPGITGLAQIKKVGTEKPDLQLKLEIEMLKSLNLKRYFYFILKTIIGKGQGDCVI